VASSDENRKYAGGAIGAAIASIIAAVGSIGGAVYFFEEHFLTHDTGVSRETAEVIFATKSELLLAQEETHDYLLDLRIEQAAQRQRDLEDRERVRALSTNEKRRLKEADQELERLYNLKEQSR